MKAEAAVKQLEFVPRTKEDWKLKTAKNGREIPTLSYMVLGTDISKCYDVLISKMEKLRSRGWLVSVPVQAWQMNGCTYFKLEKVNA